MFIYLINTRCGWKILIITRHCSIINSWLKHMWCCLKAINSCPYLLPYILISELGRAATCLLLQYTLEKFTFIYGPDEGTQTEINSGLKSIGLETSNASIGQTTCSVWGCTPSTGASLQLGLLLDSPWIVKWLQSWGGAAQLWLMQQLWACLSQLGPTTVVRAFDTWLFRYTLSGVAPILCSEIAVDAEYIVIGPWYFDAVELLLQ